MLSSPHSFRVCPLDLYASIVFLLVHASDSCLRLALLAHSPSLSKPSDHPRPARLAYFQVGLLSLSTLPSLDFSISASSEVVDTSPKSPGLARGENIRRLQSTWSNHGPIGVQATRKPPIASPSPSHHSFNTTVEEPKLTRQALPGLAKAQTVASPPSPSPPVTPPLTTRQERKSSPSPVRHGRIPSTGNRPTVMDVAQTFHETPPTSP